MTVDAAPLELETDRLLLHTLRAGEEARLQRVFEACADHFALEPLGDLAHFIIRSQLNRIFDHRQLKVAELLTLPLENSVLT